MAFAQRFKSFQSYLRGRPTSGRVYRLVAEITNACNLKCLMCPRNKMRRQVEHMDRGTFEKIVAGNRPHLEFVSLNGYGDPLLHPDLFEYLEICREHGVKTGISTNCTTLDEKMARKLLAGPPDQLILALDSVVKESYKRIRVGADFDNVLQNATRFLRLREGRPGPPFVIIQCIYMPETENQIRKFSRYFNDYRYDAIRIRQLTHTGRERKGARYRHKFSPCYWLWVEPMILSNGTVVPCCQDVNGELALGNIKENSLGELWAKGPIATLREKHAEGERGSIPICGTCNMYQPSLPLAFGSSFFHTETLNRKVPLIETGISFLRY